MRSFASIVLAAVAVAQLLLLGASGALIVLRLRAVEAEVTRLGREEQDFVDRLGLVESDLYRAAIQIRDSLGADSQDNVRGTRELDELLTRLSVAPLHPPTGSTPELRQKLTFIETARQDYLERARTISSWNAERRRKSGKSYLAMELAPTRERFSTAVAEISSVVTIVRESRNRQTATSISAIGRLTVQVISGAALLGLALAAAAIWKFFHYERDRDVQLKRLTRAEEGLRALSQRLVEAQEKERKSLSRELHDEVGQVLTALRVQLGQVSPNGDGSSTHLRQASELAERSLQTVRQMARYAPPCSTTSGWVQL